MVDGVLVSIKCVICEAIIAVGKHIMPKWDNLEKHMEKWQVEHIFNKSLKKIQALLWEEQQAFLDLGVICCLMTPIFSTSRWWYGNGKLSQKCTICYFSDYVKWVASWAWSFEAYVWIPKGKEKH